MGHTGKKSWMIGLLVAMLALVALPAWAVDIYLNGAKIPNLKNVELENCTVKFDANGDLQILSPGYRVEYAPDGTAKVVGQSDMAGAKSGVVRPKQRYAMVYEPNAKVNFSFEVWLNGRLLRKIGLDAGRFMVDLGQELVAGNNNVRVIAKPLDGTAAAGTEIDTASLRIYRGEVTADGTFRAKPPALVELVRSALDKTALDRNFSFNAE